MTVAPEQVGTYAGPGRETCARSAALRVRVLRGTGGCPRGVDRAAPERRAPLASERCQRRPCKHGPHGGEPGRRWLDHGRGECRSEPRRARRDVSGQRLLQTRAGSASAVGTVACHERGCRDGRIGGPRQTAVPRDRPGDGERGRAPALQPGGPMRPRSDRHLSHARPLLPGATLCRPIAAPVGCGEGWSWPRGASRAMKLALTGLADAADHGDGMAARASSRGAILAGAGFDYSDAANRARLCP